MKQSELTRKLGTIEHRDTAMRYVWRCGKIIKDERIEVRGNGDVWKLGVNRYRLAQTAIDWRNLKNIMVRIGF